MKKPTKFQYFYDGRSKTAQKWVKRIDNWLKRHHPQVKEADKPDFVIVLGGDGTILEASRKFLADGVPILGLGLGRISFLASVSKEEDFLSKLGQVLQGAFHLSKRLAIETTVTRKNKQVYQASALNDVVIQSPLNIVELVVNIEGFPYQNIRGTGALIATPTGSTAYNLSAKGPIVSPTVQSMIVTELLDHNLPTPSLVIDPSRQIEVDVKDFRTSNGLYLSSNQQAADVVITTDGTNVFPLEKADVITIKKSRKTGHFIEVDQNHFYKSLQDKFTLR